MEVLQALPPDIRDSIERALRMEERRHQSDRADGRSSSESDIPGCSFWTESASHFDPALPSFSQVLNRVVVVVEFNINCLRFVRGLRTVGSTGSVLCPVMSHKHVCISQSYVFLQLHACSSVSIQLAEPIIMMPLVVEVDQLETAALNLE